MLTARLQQHTADLVRRGLYRQRHVMDKMQFDFSSNDYLSLAEDARIQRAYQTGFARYPTGSGGSMVVCGYHSMHRALERAFAEALQVDDCLLFSSGYAANLSIAGLLADFGSSILIDKAIHASIYDGLRAKQAAYSRYLHQNLEHLSQCLQKASRPTVVMTEGVFSMSGQRAALRDIADMLVPHQQHLIVDEAHAFGVLGEQGLGSVVEHGLTQKEVPLRMIPFGKACASMGAVVAGNVVWIEALLQSARPYLYSTGISPACAYGLLETLEVIRAADTRRAKLFQLVDYFRDAIADSPLRWRDSCSPIQQLQLACPHQALRYAAALKAQSITCLPMRQPSVSQQETGLRIILNHHHEPEHLDRLIQCLHQL